MRLLYKNKTIDYLYMDTELKNSKYPLYNYYDDCIPVGFELLDQTQRKKDENDEYNPTKSCINAILNMM